MFIKIKAQSSDLENQYIKERDIFKKRRKSPKLLLSGLLVAAIGGYFYYLNSGIPLQTDQTAVTYVEPEQNNIQLEFTETADTLETNNQAPLITEAIANDDESGQLQTAQVIEETDGNDSISEDIDSSNIDSSNQETSDLADEIANEAPETAPVELVISEDSDIDENVETAANVTQESESLASNLNADADNQINSEELIEENQLETLIPDDSDTDINVDNLTSISQTDIEEPVITEKITAADIEEDQVEEPTFENVDNIEVTEEIAQIEESETELAITSDDALDATEKTEIASATNGNEQDNETVKAPDTEPQDTSIVTDAQNTIETEEFETEETNEVQTEIEIAPQLADNEEQVDVPEDELLSANDPEIINQQPGDIDETSIEVTDQTLAALEPSENSPSVVEKVKESRSIQAISNMISNVFAKSSDEKEELVAEVIEIDFSKVTNPEQGQERVAIVTVTDSVEQAYQGNSVEELTQSDNETINIEALDTTKVTTFEVSESEVDEIIEKEKLTNASNSTGDDSDAIFEGVDSIAAFDIPDITKLTKKSESTKTVPPKTNQNEKQEKSTSIEVVNVESVNVSPTEPEINDTKAESNNNDQDITVTTNTQLTTTAVPNKNVSTITIKDLYDQLMTDLDQKNQTVTEQIESPQNKTKEQITVKQIYEQIAKAAKEKQSTMATDETEVIAALPTEKANTSFEVEIDPDQSLALANPDDADNKLDSVEEITIDDLNDAEITEKEPSDKDNVESVKINTDYQLTDNKGSTALMIASLNSDMQTVRELVQQGAKVNKRNDWGWTALLNASIKGNQELVEYLLRNGASPHLADNDGRSPLMAAVLNNHPEVVKTLLKYKADVNKANRDGWTALSFAAWNGDTASVKYLLEANAFIQHRTSEGLTPLQLAQKNGHTEIIRLLSL